MANQTDYLYHYTSLETLLNLIKGIEKGKFKFWASSIYTMNDPQEFLYGYDICIAVLSKIEKELKIDNRLCVSKLWDTINVKKDWKLRLCDALYDKNKTPFVISFSSLEDSLPMWNAYSSHGYGVNLCFKSHIMKPLFDIKDFSKKPEIDLKIDSLPVYEVSYDKLIGDSKRNFIKVLKELYKELIDKLKGLSGEKLFNKKLSFLTLTLVILAPYFKDKAYKYEQELRITAQKKNDDDVLFRVSNGRLIPYIERAIPVKYLKSITIGPCADYKMVSRVVKQLLQKYNLKDVEVKSSKIAYKAL